jgi:hypothetical protein
LEIGLGFVARYVREDVVYQASAVLIVDLSVVVKDNRFKRIVLAVAIKLQ